MGVQSRLVRGARAVLEPLSKGPSMLKAFASWPVFSTSSYLIIRRLLDQGIAPRTVVDVGAHRGEFAVASAKLLPGTRVHSFEPVPECADELQNNVRDLGDVVTIHRFALGEEEQTLQLNINSFSPSSSLLTLAPAHRRAFPEAREQRTTEARVRTLDQVFEGVELRSPVLLKLDVQGYEAHVLRGGRETLRRTDYVVLETSFKPMYQGEAPFTELARMMEGQGFSLRGPVSWLRSPKTGEILQMDALFVRED